MRKEFAELLYARMSEDTRIWLISLDLGFGLFNRIQEDFPDRFLNTGAAEQSGMDIAIGLALSGKKVVVYSITPFLLYRPFEAIRLYIDHERIPVLLVGSGRDKDYEHDGFSHDATDVPTFLRNFKHIIKRFPQEKEELPTIMKEMFRTNVPYFLSLRR